MSFIKNTIFIFSLLVVGALVTEIKSSPSIPSSLKSNDDRYDYTYNIEEGPPEIGENASLEYDKRWSQLLSAGWRLHSVKDNIWIFERKRK